MVERIQEEVLFVEGEHKGKTGTAYLVEVLEDEYQPEMIYYVRLQSGEELSCYEEDIRVVKPL